MFFTNKNISLPPIHGVYKKQKTGFMGLTPPMLCLTLLVSILFTLKIEPMPFLSEFIAAYNWIKSGETVPYHPVRMFFTRHTGSMPELYSGKPAYKDFIIYATGYVERIEDGGNIPKKHLRGYNLKVSKNTNNFIAGRMADDPTMTFDVDIYPEEGKMSYQMKVNNTALGGAVALNVTTIDNVLLTGAKDGEVVVVGLEILPETNQPFAIADSSSVEKTVNA
jgi:hypothetical protein